MVANGLVSAGYALNMASSKPKHVYILHIVPGVRREKDTPRQHDVEGVLQVLTWSWILNKLEVLFGLPFDSC